MCPLHPARPDTVTVNYRMSGAERALIGPMLLTVLKAAQDVGVLMLDHFIKTIKKQVI